MAENINIKIYTEIEQKKQGHLFGVFFEDLNHAADGGLYAELNEGSPGQALKRLLGLRTFGSPAAQTLASHTSFAGM